MVWSFYTDGFKQRRGFRVSALRPSCDQTGAGGPKSPILGTPYTARVSGILLGTGDVVYTWLAARPSTETVRLALWGKGNGYHDFDIYARCNAWPTVDLWTVKGFSGPGPEGDTEYIELPTSCTSNWGIAIHSYNGKGEFNLVPSTTYYPGAGYTVGIDHTPVAGELDTIRNQLILASRRFYGMTEGQLLLSHFEVYITPKDCPETACNGGHCNICFKAEKMGGVGRSSGLTRRINCFQDANSLGSCYTDPRILAHEMGHAVLVLEDEYCTDPPPLRWTCGNSVMANGGDPSQNNLCTTYNHQWQGDPTALPGASYACPQHTQQPAWPNISTSQPWPNATPGLLPVTANYTPDNYSYVDFPFAEGIHVNFH